MIGGKLSEGINFSDNLGRGVVVVGLPFPNAHSAEWKAKLDHVEKTAYERAVNQSAISSSASSEMECKSLAKATGRELYENACMRAVNQSVGRAIRHQSDYACIILLDKRYQSERIKSKLPGWIQKGIVQDGGRKSFAEVMGGLSAFFRAKKIRGD